LLTTFSAGYKIQPYNVYVLLPRDDKRGWGCHPEFISGSGGVKAEFPSRSVRV